MSENDAAGEVTVTASRRHFLTQPSAPGRIKVEVFAEKPYATEYDGTRKTKIDAVNVYKSVGITGHITETGNVTVEASNGSNTISNVTVDAGGKYNYKGGIDNDHITVTMAPATSEAQLKGYDPKNVTVDGGLGDNDKAYLPGSSILTAQKDGSYMVTDKNGYAFTMKNVERVVNTTPNEPQAEGQKDSPDAGKISTQEASYGTAINVARLEPGKSIAVSELTERKYDPRVGKTEEAIPEASAKYQQDFQTCMAQAKEAGVFSSCADVKYEKPTLSTFGPEPDSAKYERHSGPLPTPKVVDKGAKESKAL